MKKPILALTLVSFLGLSSQQVLAGPPGPWGGHHGGGPGPIIGDILAGLVVTGMVMHIVNGITYYQDRDVWYRYDRPEDHYVVVAPPSQTVVVANNDGGSGVPFGSVYESLPPGAVAVVINGVQYFEKGGTLFLPSQQNGHQVYVVVRQ